MSAGEVTSTLLHTTRRNNSYCTPPCAITHIPHYPECDNSHSKARSPATIHACSTDGTQTQVCMHTLPNKHKKQVLLHLCVLLICFTKDYFIVCLFVSRRCTQQVGVNLPKLCHFDTHFQKNCFFYTFVYY